MLRVTTLCVALVFVGFGTQAQAQYQQQNHSGSGWWFIGPPTGNVSAISNYRVTSSPYGGSISYDTPRYHYDVSSTPWGGSINKTPRTTDSAAYTPARTVQSYIPLPIAKNDWKTGDVYVQHDGSTSYAHTTITSLGTKSTRFYSSKSEYLAAVAKEKQTIQYASTK